MRANPLLLLFLGASWLGAQTQAPVVNAITHAATFLSVSGFPAGTARGTIVSIFGTNLSSGTAAADRLPLPTQLPGTSTQVLIGSTALPLFYVSPTQINAQLPLDLPSPFLVVRNGNLTSSERSVPLTSVDPGMFTILQTGTGPAAILHPDGSLVSPANPVKPGGFLILFATGMGASTPSVAAGQPAPASEPPARLVTVPTVQLSGKPGAVTFAGKAPNFVGLDQVNVQVPSDMTEPTPEVLLQQGQRTAPTVSAGAIGLFSAAPLTAPTGSGNMTLSATGLNITANASLYFGGRRLASSIQGGPRQTITATIPASALRVVATEFQCSECAIPVFVMSPETGNTRSNGFDFNVTGTTIPGTAPTISNLTLTTPSILGPFAVYTADFDFQDPDGDIVFNGSLRNSARVEIDTPSCRLTASNNTLNAPDQTAGRIVRFQHLVLRARSTTGTVPASLTLIDQAGNRSNTLSASIGAVYCP